MVFLCKDKLPCLSKEVSFNVHQRPQKDLGHIPKGRFHNRQASTWLRGRTEAGGLRIQSPHLNLDMSEKEECKRKPIHLQTHENIGAIVKRIRERGNNNLQDSVQFQKYFPRHVGDGRETSSSSGGCVSDIPTICISHTSTPSSVCKGQKRGVNHNMHDNESNKSVKREPIPQYKRGLPVAWGKGILSKCPKLLNNFDRFSANSNSSSIDRISRLSVCTRPPE